MKTLLILSRELVCMEAFIGRFVVFPRCEIHDGLRETGPQIDVVVGPYDRRQSEAWKLELKALG